MQFKFVTYVLTAAVLSSLLLMASHPAPAITGLADDKSSALSVLPENHYRRKLQTAAAEKTKQLASAIDPLRSLLQAEKATILKFSMWLLRRQPFSKQKFMVTSRRLSWEKVVFETEIDDG